MGYTLPEWLDEILDFIGINFPNVDEDDYHEMADALREFAEKFETHGGDAHQAVNRVLSSSEGWAVDSLQEHWGKVKSSHLDEVPRVARLFATACDTVGEVIFWMKRKAEAELIAMAASIGISLSLAVATGGLSALLGAAQTAAMREAIRRIIKEAQQEIVDRLIAELTEPVTGKLEAMAEDMILDIASDAISLPPGGGDGGGSHSGASGMNLNSAGGGGGGGRMKIDTAEVDGGADKLSGHGKALGSSSDTALTRAQGAFGRTKGRDSFTQPFDALLDGALSGTKKAMKKVADHLGEGVPGGLRTMSRNHKRNEQNVTDSLKAIDPKAEGKSPGGVTPMRPQGRTDPGTNAKPPSPELSQKARPDEAKCKNGDPIDMATGQMLQTQTDLVLPGVLPLAVERTHLSGYAHGHFFGPSWASSLDERLEVAGAGGALWWHRADGSSLQYDHAPDLIGEEVLPREGRRIPLTCVQGSSAWDLAVTDPRTGLTRRFLPAPEADGVWWLAEVEDRNGNGISIDREDDGTPTAVRHDAGYHVEVSCEDGLVTGIALRTPDGPVQVMRYGYDGDCNLTDVVNSSGLPLRFGYDDQHRITSWTDRNDSTYQYVYDERGRVAQTVGPEGYLSSQVEYDAQNRTTRYTDSLGAVTTYHLNHLGQVVAETDPLGHTVHSEWDRHDNLTSRTDPFGNTTTFTYDEADNLVAVDRPDGTRVTTEYNRLHLPTEVTAPGGAVWRQEYDGRGNRTSVTAPDGATTQFTHDASGAVATLTDALGAETRVVADPAGLPLTVTDPLGAETVCVRDSFGRPVAITDAAGAMTRMEWTVEGKPSRRIAPDGTEETWTWDGEGNCLSHTDPAGGASSFAYTHFDQLVSRTTPDGARYAFTYDTELRLTKVTNPYGLSWDYTYDRAGNLVAESDFDGREVTYSHDAAGRLAERTTPLGATFTYTHDAVGRTVTKSVGDAETRYTHDEAGRLLRAASHTSVLDLQYDPVGRLVAETVDGRATRYTYDQLGRRTTRTTPTGAVSTFTYDLAGNRTSLSADGHTLAFSHDALGRETERTFGDGDSVALHSGWDPLGRLIRQELVTDTRPQRARHYAYRADSYLTSVTDDATGAVQHMDLDPVGRPLTVTADGWSETYAYDQAGNQTRAEWPDQAGRTDARGERAYEGTSVVSAGGVRYEHDDAGRMTLRQKTRLSRKPDTWRYEWDAEDRLTACTTPDGTRWTYTYDPLGRRTAKHRLGPEGETVETVWFTWDGTRLAEQYDSATGVTLTWDHEGHRPLTQYERKHLTQEQVDSRFFAIVTDLVGTPTELVDETGGIAWHTRSTLWGTTTWNADATAYTPLRFPGQYADPETGLHYNFFRHYDPDTARYASPDPLGLDAAPNSVAYVDNPHIWSDPLGLKPGVCPVTGKRVNPRAYTALFEMQLNTADYGRSRGTHFRRANAALDAAIKADPELGKHLDQFSPGIADRVSSTGGRKDPVDHTWQHEPSSNAGGRMGVMRLVPTYQHTGGSPWWDVLHPGNSGGYAEWAIPNGAPPNSSSSRR